MSLSAAACLNQLGEAYGPLLSSHWEKEENPQRYEEQSTSYVHSDPKRHVVGLIGGNDVSLIRGNMVDLESDLRRIHLPLTFAPWKQYQPPQKGQKEIVRENVKGSVKIDIQKAHLPTYQMWAYPSVTAPLPLVNQVCVRPEKY